ncbi:hypothetical protein F4804DRAFT_314324, partial [Jackrogersella minutella]
MLLDIIAHPEQGLRCAEYVFADISEYFLPAAKKFKMHDQVHYRTLDIEVDPGTQGFEQGIYDVVVAAHVLHATKDLNVTLSNVR